MSLTELKYIINQKVTIESYQSTFVILNVDNRTVKITLNNKKEFWIKNKGNAPLKYFESHPLLLDYNYSFETVYLNSKVDNIDNFIIDFKKAIDDKTQGWRDWKKYIVQENFFTFDTFKKNLLDGSGRLIDAPNIITKNIVEVCEKLGVKVKISEPLSSRIPEYKLLMIGNNYIIAKEFKIQPNKIYTVDKQ